MTRRKPNTDHVYCDTTAPNWVFRCRHCFESFELVLPQRIRFCSAVMTAWLREHKGCLQQAPIPTWNTTAINPTASSDPGEFAPAADSLAPATRPPEEPKP
jgi:hypothetical protein